MGAEGIEDAEVEVEMRWLICRGWVHNKSSMSGGRVVCHERREDRCFGL